ncbi:MAG: isopentenyl phosphate kinase [Brevefilum sp.]
MMSQSQLVLIKLGGSLITDKTQAMTPRLDVIENLAEEIATAHKALPNLRLVIGHGSGSFGHEVADRYQTQAGGKSPTYWQGFSEVWRAARALNHLVIQALLRADLPVVAFPPSAMVITHNHQVRSWDLQPIRLALSHGLIPVVYGDVVFDTNLGGTILSTEDLFQHLAPVLHPQRILIAGLDQGVYHHPQHPDSIIPLITPQNLAKIRPALSPSHAVDVTGGMLAKVETMVALVKACPGLIVNIFSGATPGNLSHALTHQGAPTGTTIANPLEQ